MTMHEVEAGKAVLVGFFAGASYLDTEDQAWVEFFGALMNALGVASPIEMNTGGPEVRARMLGAGDEYLLFFFNYGEEEAKVEAVVPGMNSYKELTGTAASMEGAIRLILPPRKVAVAHCRTIGRRQ